MSSEESEDMEPFWYTDGDEDVALLRDFIPQWDSPSVALLFQAFQLDQLLSFKWLVENRKELPGGRHIDLHERFPFFVFEDNDPLPLLTDFDTKLNIAELIMVHCIFKLEDEISYPSFHSMDDERCGDFLRILLNNDFNVGEIRPWYIINTTSENLLNTVLHAGASMAMTGAAKRFAKTQVWEYHKKKRSRALTMALGFPLRSYSERIFKK